MLTNVLGRAIIVGAGVLALNKPVSDILPVALGGLMVGVDPELQRL